MSRIFICHAPADSQAVEGLMRSLVVAGARQEDIEAERDAPEGIRRAGVVMLYASQHALDDSERLASVRLAACYAVPVVLALAPDVRSDDVRLADIDATIVDSAEAASLATVSSALSAAGEDRQPRIFISYSRRDLDRARALALALRARRLRVFLDLANLQPGEDWLARLYAYIDDADAVIFAMSAASLSSAICADEVARAQAAGKRVLPVRIATITAESLDRAPEQLRRLNQVFAAASDNWPSALEEIEAWATRDADWHRAHSELFRAATAWDAGSRRPDRLLRGAVLENARATLAKRPKGVPDSPDLVGEFIIASGTQELFEENRLLRGVANGFAARAQDAISQQRYTLATKCAAAAAIMAKDPRFSPDRAANVWKIAARSVSRAAISALVGHRGYVSSVRFSADETTVLTSGADGTCRIWDLNTGAEKLIYRQHENKVNFASFSPDGELIVSAGEDGTARLWQARDGLTLRILFGHEAAVNRSLFTIDGLFIVTTSDDRTIRLWDASTGANVRVFKEHSREVLEAVLSPDGLRIATTSQDGTVRLWDLASGHVCQPRCRSTVIASGRPLFSTADFSPDGGCVLSASVTGEVFIWDTHTTDQRLAVRAHDDLILTARFARDGRRFVTAGSFDHIARVWDSSTGTLVATLTGHSQRVSCAAFSPDGSRIVTGSADGTARIWVASTGQELWRSDRHGQDLTTAVWSRTGSRILTAGRDGTACIWRGYIGPTLAIDFSEGAVVDALDNDAVSVFAVVGKDRGTRVFDLWSQREQICRSPNEEWDNVVLFSADGACLLAGNETRLALVKTDDVSVLLEVRANRRRVSSTLRHLAWEFSDFLPLSFGRLVPAC